MYKKLIIISGLLILTILATGCGIAQSDYDKAQAQILKLNNDLVIANNTSAELQAKISAMINPPKYFENRTAIENWLKLVPNLGVSKDIEQWFQYAIYYQRKAMSAGYYLSISYSIQNKKVSITCDIFTIDGDLFYFDPDNLVLHDTQIQIDMAGIDDLDKYSRRLQ